MTRVKLCGLSTEADVAAAVEAGADFLGFVVNVPRSHRSVSPNRLAELCRAAEAACDGLPAGARPRAVGVFVDEPPAEVAGAARAARLGAVQLHGSEDEAYLAGLRALLPDGCLVIQAFRVRGPDDVARARASSADLVLLDSGAGSGERFDWGLLGRVGRPFLLAGGLAPENVGEALATVAPWGVDVSSGVEVARVKDPARMRELVARVRAFDAHRTSGGDLPATSR